MPFFDVVPDAFLGDTPLDTAHNFKDGLATLARLIDDAENDRMNFPNAARKAHYLDYLYGKQEEYLGLYRQQFLTAAGDARLSPIGEDRAAALIQELPFEQLAILLDNVDRYGARKVFSGSKWEDAVREVLSTKPSRDEAQVNSEFSLIKPRIWEGADIAQEEDIAFSRYYYNGQNYIVYMYCGNKDPEPVYAGKHLPREVTARITRTSNWALVGEQVWLYIKMLLTPQNMVDVGYAASGAYTMGGTEFLPEGMLPSDIPIVAELLENLDGLSHTTNVTKDTINITVCVKHQYMGNRLTFFDYNKYGAN